MNEPPPPHAPDAAPRDLATRGLRSVSWNFAATFSRAAVQLVRAVVLTRVLPVETFGVYGLAFAVAGLALELPAFGLGGAMLHRSEWTRDEDTAAAGLFTLRLCLLTAWSVLFAAGAFAFAEGELLHALLALGALLGGLQLSDTAKHVLLRRVQHGRLAVLRVVDAVATTAVAIPLALSGAGVWALIATDVASLACAVVGLYVWRPVWRPRLTFDRALLGYYLRFGSRNVVATLLTQSLEKVDKLFTGWFLGTTALGFYGRAATFAGYPRQFLNAPVDVVIGGAYAELHGDRAALSRAFMRTNMALLRASFCLGGALALVAPELIRELIGRRWLEMLDAFRLMLLVPLLDPLRRSLTDLFVAAGQPGRLAQIRVLQFAILAVGLLTLAPQFRITGVAVAVNLMLATGIGALLWCAREHVDCSLRRLFLVPSLALASGLVLARFAIDLPGARTSAWTTGGVKLVIFAAAYGSILWLFERRELREARTLLARVFLRPRPGGAA